MMNYSLPTAQPEYDVQFWNMARGRIVSEEFLKKGYNIGYGTYLSGEGDADCGRSHQPVQSQPEEVP